MMHSNRENYISYKYKAVLLLILLMAQSVVIGDQLPEKLSSAILIKIIEFDERIKEQSLIRIHVISDKKMFDQLKMFEGKKVGYGQVERVSYSEMLIEQDVSVVYVGKNNNIDEIIEQTRKNKILSISSEVSYSGRGVSVVMFDDEGVPGILLNVLSSRLEGAKWDPEILEIVNIVDDNPARENVGSE